MLFRSVDVDGVLGRLQLGVFEDKADARWCAALCPGDEDASNRDTEKAYAIQNFLHHLSIRPLQGKCLRGVDVANRNGQRIGCVGRLRRAGQLQQASHHELHLLLLSQTVSNHGLFDGEGFVFGYRKICGGRSQQRHTAHLSQFQSRFRVDGVENLFNRHDIGLVKGQ